MAKSVKSVVKKLIPDELLNIRARLIYRSRVRKVTKHRVKAEYDPKEFPQGINVMGPVKAEMGLGQSCRLVSKAVEASGFDYTIQNINLADNVRNEDKSWEDKITDKTEFGINIIHLEPPEMMFNCVNFDENLWNKRYNIAFWLWELEDFPFFWEPAIDLVDEIWTPSEFTSESIRKVTDKPVKTIPYYVTARTREGCDRKYFGLPEDKFLYLIMYDANSTMIRKNPMGAIEAYKKAFPTENRNAGLVIKMNNPKEKDLTELKALLQGYENVYFVTEILEKDVVNSLIANVDAFVSLHRAEGFGLVMAEAMLNGTPCIATNWSSNTEFMNDDVACMVDYDFITLGKNMSPYPKGSKWADANTDSAAKYMIKLYEDREFYEEIATKAKTYIENKLSLEKAGQMVRDRILEIMN